jgi:NADH dehydrogenase
MPALHNRCDRLTVACVTSCGVTFRRVRGVLGGMSEHSTPNNKVVVVGGGYAGAVAANRLRMSSYAAGPLGAQAVNTVLSRIAGTEPAVLSVAFSGACVSLGRRSAVRQLAGQDDSPVNVYIGGRPGAAIKELTCKFGVLKIRREAREPGCLIWPKGGPRPDQPATAARGVTSP